VKKWLRMVVLLCKKRGKTGLKTSPNPRIYMSSCKQGNESLLFIVYFVSHKKIFVTLFLSVGVGSCGATCTTKFYHMVIVNIFDFLQNRAPKIVMIIEDKIGIGIMRDGVLVKRMVFEMMKMMAI
jgi:hypothetical protein